MEFACGRTPPPHHEKMHFFERIRLRDASNLSDISYGDHFAPKAIGGRAREKSIKARFHAKFAGMCVACSAGVILSLCPMGLRGSFTFSACMACPSRSRDD